MCGNEHMSQHHPVKGRYNDILLVNHHSQANMNL